MSEKKQKNTPEPISQSVKAFQKEEIQRSLYWFITHVNPFSGFVRLPFEVVFDKKGNGYFKDEPPDCFRDTIIEFLNEEADEIGYELEEFPISNTYFFRKVFEAISSLEDWDECLKGAKIEASINWFLTWHIKKGAIPFKTKDGKEITTCRCMQRLWDDAGLRTKKPEREIISTLESYFSYQYVMMLEELEQAETEKGEQVAGAGKEGVGDKTVNTININVTDSASAKIGPINQVGTKAKQERMLSPKPKTKSYWKTIYSIVGFIAAILTIVYIFKDIIFSFFKSSG